MSQHSEAEVNTRNAVMLAYVAFPVVEGNDFVDESDNLVI